MVEDEIFPRGSEVTEVEREPAQDHEAVDPTRGLPFGWDRRLRHVDAKQPILLHVDVPEVPEQAEEHERAEYALPGGSAEPSRRQPRREHERAQTQRGHDEQLGAMPREYLTIEVGVRQT